ncbi:MAG TPA: ferritin [bacterium]|jgi:ferritin|nr:ferritin [bacterium]
MLKPDILKAMNAQINAEFYSSFLYLAMAAHFEGEALPGIAHWMRVQAVEEHGHGMKFFEQMVQRGAQPVMETLQAPPAHWTSAEAAFKHVLEHEQHVTGLINALAALARKDADFATENFLQYFIKEQVEEEAQAQLLHQQFQMVGPSKGSLMMMDHRLGKRAGE